MKKIILLLIGCLFIFTGCVEEKKFEVPKLTGRVVDTANILSNEEKENIENAILNFEKNTGGQFAVCIVPEMTGETVESASIKVAESWKIGNKDKDDGIIFFMSMKEREFRIEVGYGYEGKLNDAQAGDLGRLAIPKFKEEKWGEGIVIIVNGCSNVVSGKTTVDKLVEESSAYPPLWIIIVFVVLGIIIVIKTDGGIFFYGGGSSGYKGGGNSYKGGGGSFGGGGFSGKF